MMLLTLLGLGLTLALFAAESAVVPGLESAALKLAAVLPVGAALRRRRGRPRKFSAPSKAVTLTLPENVLQMLATIDPDPSMAIVQLTRRRAPVHGRPAAAELSVFGQRAVITIRPTRSLERQIGIDLVPLPDGRALISFDQPTTVAELELMLYDALQDPSLSDDDRSVFEGIAKILTDARRSDDVTLLNRSIIVLESSRTRRRRAPKTAAR